jgi:hypothetical protein
MTSQPWHPQQEALAAYAAGAIGVPVVASIEAHLLACAECRGSMAGLAPAAVVARGREQLRMALPTIRYPFLVRVAQRLGLRDADAVLLGQSRIMTDAWLLSIIVVVGFAVFASSFDTRASDTLFLVIAPLVPVLGVCLSYATTGPTLEELATASPYSSMRLTLLRTAAVLAPCLLISLVAAVAGQAHLLMLAWLLPSLAFTLLVLAASTWFSVELTGIVVALGWAFCVGLAAWRHDPAAAVAADLQPLYLLVAAVAAVTVAVRVRRDINPGGIA